MIRRLSILTLNPMKSNRSLQKGIRRKCSTWYSEGLSFKCTGCGKKTCLWNLSYIDVYEGKCCTGQSGWVWITEKDAENISAKLNTTQDKFYQQYTRKIPSRKGFSLIEKQGKGGLDCIFLEDGKFCKIYDARPNQCRLYVKISVPHYLAKVVRYPFWSEVTHSKEDWSDESQYCEGINHTESELYTKEQIEEKLNIYEKTRLEIEDHFQKRK